MSEAKHTQGKLEREGYNLYKGEIQMKTYMISFMVGSFFMTLFSRNIEFFGGVFMTTIFYLVTSTFWIKKEQADG